MDKPKFCKDCKHLRKSKYTEDLLCGRSVSSYNLVTGEELFNIAKYYRGENPYPEDVEMCGPEAKFFEEGKKFIQEDPSEELP